MESDTIVEGFLKSVEMYGVKYAGCMELNIDLLVTGIAMSIKKILDTNPYINITVGKIECKNHMLSNTCYKFKDVARNSKFENITCGRKNFAP